MRSQPFRNNGIALESPRSSRAEDVSEADVDQGAPQQFASAVASGQAADGPEALGQPKDKKRRLGTADALRIMTTAHPEPRKRRVYCVTLVMRHVGNDVMRASFNVFLVISQVGVLLNPFGNLQTFTNVV